MGKVRRNQKRGYLDGESVEVVHHHVIWRGQEIWVTVHTNILIQDTL